MKVIVLTKLMKWTIKKMKLKYGSWTCLTFVMNVKLYLDLKLKKQLMIIKIIKVIPRYFTF